MMVARPLVTDTTTALLSEPAGATEAARTLFARTSFIDDNSAAGNCLAIEAVDRGLGIGVRAHFDETEAL